MPTLGCEDWSRFSTASGETYCGNITLGAAFRTGFSPRVQMSLHLDAAALEGPDSPGTLSTQELRDDVPEGVRRLFVEAPLRPIAPLTHDVLSRPDLGGGRLRTVVYAVSPSEPEAEGALAFLSLRSDGAVEARLLRPGRASADGNEPPDSRHPLFGVFVLQRRLGKCF